MIFMQNIQNTCKANVEKRREDMKKNFKRLVTLCLVVSMALSMLVGCGVKKETDTTSPDATATPTNSATQEEATPYDFSDRKHYTLKLMMYGDADTEQCDAIAAELSKITEEKLNANVELVRVGFGSYATQLNLVLSSGEQLDLFAPFTLGLSTLASNGQILPMDDLLPKYAPETLAAVPESDFECNAVNGKIYAVPANKDKGYSLGFIMRKDILDEIGVNVADIHSFDDLHDVLVKVKTAHPEMYPVVPDYANMFGYLQVDALSDNNGVLLNAFDSDDLTVENLYASDYFKNLCDMMYQWAGEGLTMADASSNSEGRTALMGAGKGFGGFTHMKAGFDAEQTRAVGTEVVSWIYNEPVSVTGSSGLGFSISATSGDPDRAMALLNLMYTDPEVSNLLINGIEGVHYDFVDKEKGIIDYPEGVDPSTVGYSRLAWGWANQQISYIWNGDSETVWQDLAAFNASAKPSIAKGFVFDNANVINEVTACSNVVSKYYPALVAGSLDPATTIPKFLKDLEAAGINTIMEEKQAQLNAWAAKK